MREIKFRVWSDGAMRILDHMQTGVGQIGFSDTYWTDLNDDDRGPLVLMQYTGLKDKNGKEIFEGDILRNDHGDLEDVVWTPGQGWDSDGAFGYMGAYLMWKCLPGDSEVIGNVYENPELVE